MTRISLLSSTGCGLLLAGLGAGSLGAQQPQAPCSAPEYAQFDFWVGEWDVYGPNGQLAGRNSITKSIGGCVLHEDYTTPSGYFGESFNTYDRGRGLWHQTWVDNGGLLLRLDGGLQGDSMIMEGTVIGADGSAALERITWSVVDGDEDRVRQFWQFSTDDGQTWGVRFDGEYRRRTEPAQPRSSSDSGAPTS